MDPDGNPGKDPALKNEGVGLIFCPHLIARHHLSHKKSKKGSCNWIYPKNATLDIPHT